MNENKSIGFGGVVGPRTMNTTPKIKFNYSNGDIVTVYGQENLDHWIGIIETLDISKFDYVKFSDSIVFLRNLDSIKWYSSEDQAKNILQ